MRSLRILVLSLAIVAFLLPSAGALIGPSSGVGLPPFVYGASACNGVDRFSYPINTAQVGGRILPEGVADPLWRVAGVPPGVQMTQGRAFSHGETAGIPGAWVHTDQSGWINHHRTLTIDAGGLYVYTLDYAVPAGGLEARLVGVFAGDNHVQIFEGPRTGPLMPVGVQEQNAFDRWTNLSIPVAPGARQLRVEVFNAPDGQGRGTWTGINFVASVSGDCRPAMGAVACADGAGTFAYSVSTGFDAAGRRMVDENTADQRDARWRRVLANGTLAPAYSIGDDPRPGALAPAEVSAWINHRADGLMYDSPGLRRYELAFVVPAGAHDVTVAGRYLVDDTGEVRLRDAAGSRNVSAPTVATPRLEWTSFDAPVVGNGTMVLGMSVNNTFAGSTPTGFAMEARVAGICAPIGVADDVGTIIKRTTG